VLPAKFQQMPDGPPEAASRTPNLFHPSFRIKIPTENLLTFTSAFRRLFSRASFSLRCVCWML